MGCELEYNVEKKMILCRFCDKREPSIPVRRKANDSAEKTETMWRIPPKEEVFKILMEKKFSGFK